MIYYERSQNVFFCCCFCVFTRSCILLAAIMANFCFSILSKNFNRVLLRITFRQTMMQAVGMLIHVFLWQQGVVIGVGEMSEFGSVFKMMQSEEVRTTSIHFVCLCGISPCVCMYVCMYVHSKCILSQSLLFLCTCTHTCILYLMVCKCDVLR